MTVDEREVYAALSLAAPTIKRKLLERGISDAAADAEVEMMRRSITRNVISRVVYVSQAAERSAAKATARPEC